MPANLLIGAGIVLLAAGGYLKYRAPRRVDVLTPRIERPAAPVVEAKVDAVTRAKNALFKQWVVDHINTEHHQLKDWGGSLASPNGIPQDLHIDPDLEVIFRSDNHFHPYAIECHWVNDPLGFFELDTQLLERYRWYQNERRRPVFIVLGLGGKPTDPRDIYILPLAVFVQPRISAQLLERYRQPRTRQTFFYDPASGIISI